MRLDKFLCQMNMGSRSDVKELIRKKMVSVNGVTVSAPDLQISETEDTILCKGQKLQYKRFVYYIMNKPQGVISATTDRKERTVVDLIRSRLPEQDQKRELIPVGRLDKDTEGLLLLTDDGKLAHSLLSPRRHVCKTYEVQLARPITPEDTVRLEQGVDISDTAPPAEKEDLRNQPTFPARVRTLDEHTICLSIREGRFHQVKRMLHAVGNEVTALRRIRFGALTLDTGDTLAPGAFRELTPEELEWLVYAESLTTGQTAMMKDIRAVILTSAEVVRTADTADVSDKNTDAARFLKDCLKRGIQILNIPDAVDALTAHLLTEAAQNGLAPGLTPELAPWQCIVFADSPAWINAAKEAGMRVCVIGDVPPGRSETPAKAENIQSPAQADFYFRDFDEILFP